MVYTKLLLGKSWYCENSQINQLWFIRLTGSNLWQMFALNKVMNWTLFEGIGFYNFVTHHQFKNFWIGSQEVSNTAKLVDHLHFRACNNPFVLNWSYTCRDSEWVPPSCTYWNPLCCGCCCCCCFSVCRSAVPKGLYDPGPGYGTGDCIIFLSVVDLKGAVAILGESVTSLSLIV